MRNRITLLLLTMLLLPMLALANPAPQTFQVGTLHVTRYGDHGRPLILIPGLGSGAWVWQDTIEHFEKDHVIYAVTLAGFDGTPAPAHGDYLKQADASLLELIQSRHIEKPVLVGHSIGGTLSIEFAEQHSQLLSGVVALDGLPVLPWMSGMSEAQRTQAAAGIETRVAAMTPAQFAQQQEGFMLNMGVLDPALAKKLAALQVKSDAAAVGKYLAEDTAIDLRPQLDKISVPLLEISPYDDADSSKGPRPATEAEKTAFYEGLLKGAPHVTVVSISPARHFAMYDQPEKFRKLLADFLTRLPRHH